MPKLTTLKPRIQSMPAGVQTIQPGSWRTDGMSAASRGYDHAWRKRREAQLRTEPLCRYCAQEGRVTPATVADHVTPHRGDAALFAGPLQSLCEACHGGRKAKEEADAGYR